MYGKILYSEIPKILSTVNGSELTKIMQKIKRTYYYFELRNLFLLEF